MSIRDRIGVTLLALAAVSSLAACERDAPAPPTRPLANVSSNEIFVLPDPSGSIGTFSTTGSIDLGNPFFQSMGTNGRSCASCHIQGNAWGLSAATAQAIYASSGGTDPLFAAVDGANCPSVTAADGAAGHSLLLNNGLIRVALPVPGGAQFTVEVVHDPYGCALLGTQVSMYRRPLQTTNLGFLSAVMDDGRETVQPLTSASTFLANLQTDLAHQALDATLGHAQADTAPAPATLNAIVSFELALFSAQAKDSAAGVLYAQGADGGPENLAGQTYYPGINDPLGGNPTGAPFNDTTFTIFVAWLNLTSQGQNAAARQAVARGEFIFDTHPLQITDVTGLNDALGVPVINGTCSTCHDAPNVGNHSRPLPLDIGVSHAAKYETDPQVATGLAQLSVPDLPTYKVSCTTGPLSGAVRYTSDLGRAMLTGLCSDLGRIKGPILRGLAARAPYFHNGAAPTLASVVAFYNQRFQMGLSAQESSDLVAFLKTL